MNENGTNVAVITGASSGIGYATALEFAEQGYDLVLAARRSRALEKVAEECRLHHVAVEVVPTDTSDEAAVRALANRALERFGYFDVWVNGAAVGLYGKFDEVPMDEVRQVFETDLFGYVYGSRAAIMHFRIRGQGVLINISSVVAATPQPYASIYVAAKAAIRALGESIRMELQLDKQADIHVCTVMPSSTDTNFFQNAANHTGRAVQAMNPVYDAAYVAKKIVKLAAWPRDEVIVGPAGKLMAAEHAVMRKPFDALFANATERGQFSDKTAAPTSGSVFEPTHDDARIDGGWRDKRLPADKLNMLLGVGLAAGAIAALCTWHTLRHRTESTK